MLSLNSLRKFLVAAARAGYGSSEVVIAKAADGANMINYHDGDWRMVDTFYGGHPYAGQEVIYHRRRPVWAMQYRGWVMAADLEPGQVYDFLKQALIEAPTGNPYRGPKELSDGDLTYRNDWQGDIKNFSGRESILAGNRQIYTGLYFGGLVDESDG